MTGILVSADLPAAIGDQVGNLPQVLGSPLIHAIPLAAVSLAIASWTPRRAYATGAIIALFLVSAAVGGILAEAGRGRLSEVAPLINPFVLLDGTRDWLLGGDHPRLAGARRAPGAPRLRGADPPDRGARVAAVMWRYRRISA